MSGFSMNKQKAIVRARKLVGALAIVFLLWSEGAAVVAKPAVRAPMKPHDKVVWKVDTERKWIALTFDDGPNPVYTPQILDLLHLYDAKATFFVLGKRVAHYPKIVIREINEGHEIANHTFDHDYLKNVNPRELQREIQQTQEAIFDLTEQSPRVFRPPGGFYNEAMIDLAERSRLKVVMWSWYQDTQDWRKPGADHIVNTVLKHIHNGDIVLFHDMQGDCSQTVEALRRLLPLLRKQGYQFVTVTDLIASMRK